MPKATTHDLDKLAATMFKAAQQRLDERIRDLKAQRATLSVAHYRERLNNPKYVRDCLRVLEQND